MPKTKSNRSAKKKPVKRKPPLRLEWRSPAELAENPANWRRHPEAQVAALSDVIADVGWAGACLFNETTGRLIDGHARKAVGMAQGATSIPVLVGNWTEQQERMILATLDPLAGLAQADPAALAALLSQIEAESAAVGAMLAGLAAANPPPIVAGGGGDDWQAPDVEADDFGSIRLKLGDVWVIGGRHRVACGDSTKAEDVAKALAGATPFLMVTDPPYGVNLDQSWRDEALGEKAMGPGNAEKVANDDRADWVDAYRLFTGNVAYVWHASARHTVVADGLAAAGFDVRQQIVWNKSIMVMGRGAYHWKHEPCWYAVRKGKDANWQGDRTQTTVWDAASPNHIMSGSKDDKTNHPTQKPIEIFTRPIANHTRTGDSVYDPFLGSGTTLIAAHRLGRVCYGLEIEPKYVEVILRRAEAEGLSVEKAD